MKKVAILQSNYIPWKGYFDIIAMVDEFILYDEMQYTRSDWRNRNKIKTPEGLKWLTIPVEIKGKQYQKINETIIADPVWAKNHWSTIKQFYSKAQFFNEYKEPFEQFYMKTNEKYLSKVNYELLVIINKVLEIKTKLTWSNDYKLVEGKTEKIVSLVLQANGTEFICGPAAKVYIKDQLFADAGIKLTWMDYSGYQEYTQFFPPFEHSVTILDLIFNEGPNASKFLKF